MSRTMISPCQGTGRGWVTPVVVAHGTAVPRGLIRPNPSLGREGLI